MLHMVHRTFLVAGVSTPRLNHNTNWNEIFGNLPQKVSGSSSSRATGKKPSAFQPTPLEDPDLSCGEVEWLTGDKTKQADVTKAM